MENNLTQRELTKYFVIMAIFVGILVSLKIYDNRTGEIGKVGQTIFSRFLGKYYFTTLAPIAQRIEQSRPKGKI